MVEFHVRDFEPDKCFVFFFIYSIVWLNPFAVYVIKLDSFAFKKIC